MDQATPTTEVHRILAYCQDMSKDPSKGPLFSVTNLVRLINDNLLDNQKGYAACDLEFDGKIYRCDLFSIGLSRVVKNINLVGIIHGLLFIGIIDGNEIGARFVTKGLTFSAVDKFVPTVERLLKWCEIMPISRIVNYFNKQLAVGVSIEHAEFEDDIGVVINGKTRGVLSLTVDELEHCNNRFTPGHIINLEIDLDNLVVHCIERMIRLNAFTKPQSFTYDQIVQYLTLIDVLGLFVVHGNA